VEEEMSNKRVFVIAMGTLCAVVAIFAGPAILAAASHTYQQSQQQAKRESSLGERYGALPAEFSAAQIQREYALGERYGVLPSAVTQFSADQIQREYWLGERYGVLPQQYTQAQAAREYQLGERYGVLP
jgi:hypothetical protein